MTSERTITSRACYERLELRECKGSDAICSSHQLEISGDERRVLLILTIRVPQLPSP